MLRRMEKLTIRQMSHSDLDEVCAIENASFSIPWSRNSFAEALADESNFLFVCEAGGSVVGYADTWCVLDEATITNIAVREDFRSMGIGAMLLKEALDEAKRRDIAAVTLEVRKSNVPAIKLYEKFGFEAAGIRPGYYEKPTEDAVIMWKYKL